MKKITPAKRQYFKAQKITHLAIKTSSTAETRSVPVMVYDIENQKIGSSTVFDVRVEPNEGTKLKLDTYITEYVGESPNPAPVEPAD